MGKKKRKYYAIEKLHPDIKEAVDEMIKADFTYNEIVDYIKSTGNSISKSAVQRYASNLMQSRKRSEWHKKNSVLSWKKRNAIRMLTLQNRLCIFMQSFIRTNH